MRKQSAFWLALSLRPEVLILDEPVDGLDPVMRRQVWSLVMSDVAENGTSVLVSSHNLRELEDVCDHVGILQRGRCLLEKSVADMQETTVKFVLALPEEAELPGDLDILHESASGRLYTLILRGREEELAEKLQSAQPLFLEAQPLTLEEIFVYEMGGADYAVKDILL
jgi:ABC-2 type transport system ATP-binding protein